MGFRIKSQNRDWNFLGKDQTAAFNRDLRKVDRGTRVTYQNPVAA